ncbi:hypothetical protein HY338_01785 [Candidatus Gottesmanbacteria bacterium]|nr:hypothetical protein [Candidatus Gottesmanbacteria bacterium]
MPTIKKLSPFTIIVFLFISVFATTTLVQTRQLIQKKAAIESNDIDVSYISRQPRYDSDEPKKWPSLNELVTFTAHIRNVGLDNVPNFSYIWKIDGSVVKQGSLTPNMVSQETTTTYQWSWAHQTVNNSIQGSHTIEFIADPNNLISEVSETNNSIKDYTQALAVGFWVEYTVYNYFNQNQLLFCSTQSCVGSNSWEDWAQRQIRLFNTLLASSKSEHFPQGAIDRVRLDKIVIVPDCSLREGAIPVVPFDRTLDTVWGFTSSKVEPVIGCIRDQNDGNKRLYKNNASLQNLEYSVVHELTHKRFVPDFYGLNIEVDDVLVQENGISIANTPFLPILWSDIVYLNKEQKIMGGGNFPDGYDPVSFGILNRNAGVRGTGGIELNPYYDIPTTTQFKFLSSSGQPIPNASIQIWKPELKQSEYYGQSFSGAADVFGITDNQGTLTLATDSVFDPWNRTYSFIHGLIFLYRIESNNQIAYGFQEITDLLLAYWQGQTVQALIPITTKLSGSSVFTPTPTIKPLSTPTRTPTPASSGLNIIKVKVTGAANGGVWPNLLFFVNHPIGSSVAVGTPLKTWVTSGGLQEFTYTFNYGSKINQIDLVTTNNSSNPNDLTLSSVILNNKTLFPWGATCFFDTGSSNLAFDGVTTNNACNVKIFSNGSFRFTNF